MKKIAFLFAVFSGLFAVQGQTENEKVLATVDKSDIEGHIYFLADDLLKGRETGTPENKIAASYLANALRGYGASPNPLTGDYYQEVKLTKSKPPKQLRLGINGTEYKYKVALLQADLLFKGEAVFLGHGMEEDYAGKDVTKKLVVVRGGSPESSDFRTAFSLRNQKREWARANGAFGLVELINTNQGNWGFIDSALNGPRLDVATEEDNAVKEKNTFSHIWVFDKAGEKANTLEKEGINKVGYFMEQDDKETVISQNVVGIIEGTDPQLKNEYIIYSAHYDHVGVGSPDETGDTIYNGARDNAVGVTTVLSMAENLGKYPTRRSALFILFTAEEKGLLGSKYYVENPVLPLNQMVYCFNSDNAGYNDTSKATIIGLPRTTAEGNIKKAVSEFGLTAVDDPAPEQGLFDRSDNVRFAAKGIPAPTFSLGFTAFNGTVTEYYHRPKDQADNIDYDYLEKFFKAYVLAGRLIANDPETPFWTVGDKYEAAGKELYGN